MKAFVIGLISLVAFGILASIGLLLYPFIIVLAVFLRLLVAAVFLIFAIWAFGKFIIFIWDQVFKKK